MVYGATPNYTFNNAGVFVVTLTVKDAAGNTHTDTVEITVNDTTNPVANAGPDQTVDQGDLVTFDGSGSTDNMAVDNYTWNFTDGGAQMVYGATPNYTFNNAGVFVVTLTAMDAAGNTHTDTVEITVNDTTDPTADAGLDQTVDQRDLVEFNGSGSLDNVGVNNYTWTFSDGGAKTLYGLMPNYTFQNVGNFTVTLNVTDAAGNWKTDTMWVLVNDIDAPVSGTAWNNTLTTGDKAFFSINLTDNVAVGSVMFNFTINNMTNYYWPVTNNTGDNWTIEIMIPSYAMWIEYFFWFNDTVANMDKSAMDNLSVADNDKPMLENLKNGTLNTGDNTLFEIDITDNININLTSVFFYYRYGGSAWMEELVSNRNGATWSISILILGNQTTIQYYFMVNDTSDNQNESAQSIWLPITDDDVPTVGNDLTTDIPKTGESFTIICEATDNIGVDSVYLNYTYDGGATYTLVSMIDDGDGNWSKTITVATDAISIRYNFSISDAAGNVKDTTKSAATPVVDTIPPEFVGDVTAGSPVAGADYTISVRIQDNTDTRGLLAVYVNYSVNGMGYQSLQLTHTTGNYWNRTIYVLPNATTFIYHIYARDAAGNIIDTYNPVAVPDEVADDTDPVANAGSDKSIGQHQNVTFNATLSWDNVAILNYSWTFTYGGAEVVLYGSTVNFTFHNAGVYLVWLNITDAMENWHADNLTVTVADITAPMAVPGANVTIDQGENVTLNASDSSDNVGIDNYTWTFMGKKYYGVEITLNIEDAGDFMVFLKVIDMAGNIHEANLTITVADITDPEADAGADKTGSIGAQIFFNGAGSSDNVDIVKYTWTFTDGGVQSLNGSDANYTFDTPGVFIITLTVEDAAGNTATDSFNVTVSDNVKPMAKATVDSEDAAGGANANAGDTLDLDASASSDNVGITVWNWTIESPEGDMTYYLTKTASHKFDEDGIYTVTLTITDAAGNMDTLTFDVDAKPKKLATYELPQVFEDEDGNPAEGLEVTITVDGTPYTATTDKDGKATFKNMPAPKTGDKLVVKDEDGNVVLETNYDTTKNTYATTAEGEGGILLYVIIAVVVVIAILVVVFLLMRKKPEEEEELYEGEEEEEGEEILEGEGEIPEEGIISEGIEEEVVEFQCPECGSMVAETDDVCPGCGVAFEEEEVEEEIEVVQFECPECGSLVNETDAACPGCGVEFEEEVEEYVEEEISEDVEDLEAELGELEGEEIEEEIGEEFAGDLVETDGESEIVEGAEEEVTEEVVEEVAEEETEEGVEDVAVEEGVEEVAEEETAREAVEEVAEETVEEEVEAVEEAVEEVAEETVEDTAVEEAVEEEVVEETEDVLDDEDDFDSLLEGLEDEL